jgi:hypothetical protein
MWINLQQQQPLFTTILFLKREKINEQLRSDTTQGLSYKIFLRL